MSKASPVYGARPRGITLGDVSQAADALLRAGERPTVERIRAKLGAGSPNTVGPLLDAWWSTLAARLDAGPAALHRLPESVAHVAEALWMQALEEGRRRAALEQQSSERAIAMDKQHLEVRSQVLSLREGELESRLHEREREKSTLEEQLTGLTLLLRREQVTRDVQAQRIQELENQLGQCRRQIATMIAGAIVKRRGRQHRQPAAARSSGSAIRRRSPSAARPSKPTRSKTSKIRKTTKAKQLPTRKRRR